MPDASSPPTVTNVPGAFWLLYSVWIHWSDLAAPALP
jgi:hypothetical protein